MLLYAPPEECVTIPALEPFAGLPPADQVALFNRAYEGYFLPLHVDEAAVRFMLDALDVDARASLVARVDGRPAGVVLLAVRGDRGWIGGMGVAPEARRRGVGETLMRAALAAALARGLAAVDLEVLEQNAPARRLYEKLGFAPVRALEVWRLSATAPRPAAGAREAPLAPARAWIAANRAASEPWQRADATVARVLATGAPLTAYAVDRGGARAAAAVVRITQGRAGLLPFAARDEAAAHALLDGLLARADVDVVRALNAPAGDPVAAALRARDAALEARQVEMRLAL